MVVFFVPTWSEYYFNDREEREPMGKKPGRHNERRRVEVAPSRSVQERGRALWNAIDAWTPNGDDAVNHVLCGFSPGSRAYVHPIQLILEVEIEEASTEVSVPDAEDKVAEESVLVVEAPVLLVPPLAPEMVQTGYDNDAVELRLEQTGLGTWTEDQLIQSPVVDLLAEETLSEMADTAVDEEPEAEPGIETFVELVLDCEQEALRTRAGNNAFLEEAARSAQVGELLMAVALGDESDMLDQFLAREQAVKTAFDALAEHLKEVSRPAAPAPVLLASADNLELGVMDSITGMDVQATEIARAYRDLGQRSQAARTQYNLARHASLRTLGLLDDRARTLRADLDLLSAQARMESTPSKVDSYRQKVTEGQGIVEEVEGCERECARSYATLQDLDRETCELSDRSARLVTRLGSVHAVYDLFDLPVPQDVESRVNRVQQGFVAALDRARSRVTLTDMSQLRVPTGLRQLAEELEPHVKWLDKLTKPAITEAQVEEAPVQTMTVSFDQCELRMEVLRRLMVIGYDVVVGTRAGIRGRGPRSIATMLLQGGLIGPKEVSLAIASVRDLLPEPGTENKYFVHTYMNPDAKTTSLYRPLGAMRALAQVWRANASDPQGIDAAIRVGKDANAARYEVRVREFKAKQS